MTRYARGGKGTHQRTAKESTPWNDMKPSEPERVRGANDKGGRQSGGKNKRERFSKNRPSHRDLPSANFVELGDRKGKDKGSKNGNVRGFGQSKAVKIFGQFWVPAEESKRLKSLTKKLRDQGLGRKEILETLKNERRKAEKAAKRQRDKTCFQCRQFGHVLNDCPNLNKAIAGASDETGADQGISVEGMVEQGMICFKCGSTEHTSRNCRRKGEKFEFAKCFICSGSGHIARQCPKNTNGIYPSGGSCGECGSTMHLKMDCPDLVGADQHHSSKDDNDAVTLRIADPFASTEYEPIFEASDEKDEDTTNEKESPANFPSFNISEDLSVTTGVKTSNKKKVKRKNSEIETEKQSVEKLDGKRNKTVSLASPISKPLFASAKRKVVKF